MMTTSDFFEDSDCFLSHTALRAKIYADPKVPHHNPTHVASLIQHSRGKKPVANLADLTKDKSIIIAIQNDARFANIIMSCRKQRSPIAHIFIESNRYISCIVKNAGGYPLIFIRIPIDNVYTYAQSTNNVYEFPIQDLLDKDIKLTKNVNYNMIFRWNGQNVVFSYEIHTGESEPFRHKVPNITTNNQAVIDNILKADISITHPTPTNMLYISNRPNFISTTAPASSATQENYLLAFNNMSILLLREVVDVNTVLQFNQRPSPKTVNYFEVKNRQMIFISEASNSVNEKFICSEEESILWTIVDNGKNEKYEILPYESLFKNNYSKSVTTNDRIYYMFASYLDNFLFVKLITPFDANTTREEPVKTFSKIFPKDYQILECYMCVKMSDEAGNQ